MERQLSRGTPFLLPLVVGLVTPWCTYMYLELFIKGSGYSSAMADFFSKLFLPGYDYFAAIMIGMIPFVLLSVLLWIFAGRANPSPGAFAVVSLCALGSILLPMVNTYVAIWKSNPGHPILTYVFISGYCTITMLLGMFIGWVIIRTRL